MTKLHLAAAAVAALSLVSVADAQSPEPPMAHPSASMPPGAEGPSSTTEPTGGTSAFETAKRTGRLMSAEEVQEKLQQQGYSKVSDLRQVGDKWEAEVTKDGRSVSLLFDPYSGEISTR